MTFLDDRRRGAEEAFFARQNEALRLEMAAENASGATRGSLASASGLRDPAVLDSLIGLKVGPEGAAALSLIPLVAVAWADGEVSPTERESLLSAASQAGLDEAGASYKLFAGWLDDHPPASLMASWKDYAETLTGGMTPQAVEAFRAEIVGRARKVAEAAGGFLGIGRVSAEEEATLREIEDALRTGRAATASLL